MIGNWIKIKSSSSYINVSQVFVIAPEVDSNIRYICQYWLLNSRIKFVVPNFFLFNLLSQCLTTFNYIWSISSLTKCIIMIYISIILALFSDVHYRNDTYICKLILYPTALLNLIRNYISFWLSLEFSLCTTMASIIGDVILLPSSLFFSLTFSLPQNSWCTLNRAPGSWHLYSWY
jgi:hypothetical protein